MCEVMNGFISIFMSRLNWGCYDLISWDGLKFMWVYIIFLFYSVIEDEIV